MVCRVLLVDDESSQTVTGLRVEGFHVETAQNAEGALAMLAARPFDLAIVDLMMPRTNGIQLARLIRDQHPCMHVLLTSPYHLSEPQLSRSDCGALGFVAKPLDPLKLAQFIEARLAVKARAPLGGALA